MWLCRYKCYYKKFLLTLIYSSGDITSPTTTTEEPITIPPSDMQTYEVQLVLPVLLQTNATWRKFKQVLSSSATDYVIEHKLHVEQAQ